MRRTALDMVYELAKRDPRVVFIGSDLGAGALDQMKAEMPERFFMEGVSEANVIGMAAGLAMDGFVPYVNTIATFLTRRCYEQVAVDLCLHELPVRLIANGGGVVYAPLGPTHIAIEDLAIMRALPGMTVVAPTDADEMRRLIPATLEQPGPVYIRVAKGGDPIVSRDADGFEIGKPILLREPGQVLLLATGVMVNRALAAAEELAPGLECGVLNVHTLKPLDAERIVTLCRGVEFVVTIEEHTRIGGLGSAVAEVLVELGPAMPGFLSLGIPDVFTEKYGSQDEVLEFYGLQPGQIAAAVRRALGRDAA
ncbi:MAG: transketolase C-terminal domain-containing protein [Alphaproteobacteria bacterium]|jgi:transketolase|nr:transketolase [Rhodospirillaceae bacterium]MDP6404405.1 transketolase C-terminal domain-containing protein [Alphaproteobacteria bacterium]